MADPAALLAGDPAEIGGYELVARLGEGGQGVVYLGRSGEGRQVAVKLLSVGFSGDGRARARFVREVEIARRVADFCTARVLAADVLGDRPYIVSEYVAGPSLQELVRSGGVRTGADLHRLAIGTVTALVAIHRAGIVHRDFKPPNVLMSEGGPRMIDFGIARALDGMATMKSHAIGTPAYMAPEQVAGRPLGPATDMFAWAATLVYAATGHAPFGSDTIPAVMHRILHAEPDLSGIPAPLSDILRDCLDKDPGRRPTAAHTLMRLLGHADTAAGQRAPVPAPRSEDTAAAPSTPPETRPAPASPRTFVFRGRKISLIGDLVRGCLRLLLGIALLTGAIAIISNDSGDSALGMTIILLAAGIVWTGSALVRLFPRIRALRNPYELHIGDTGLELRHGGQLTRYRWTELSRVAVRRAVPNRTWSVCVSPIPGIPRPEEHKPGSPLPYSEKKSGWIVLTPTAPLDVGRLAVEQALARCSGSLWGGNS